MDILLLYLTTRTEAMAVFLKSMVWIYSAAVMLMVIFGPLAEADFPNIFRHIKRTIWIPLIAGLLSVAMPSRADWYLIIGGYYVTNIEGIGDLPPNAVRAMNKFLEEYQTERPAKQGEGV